LINWKNQIKIFLVIQPILNSCSKTSNCKTLFEIIIIQCSLDSGGVDVLSTPLEGCHHRCNFLFLVNADNHYLGWVCLVDFIYNSEFQNCCHGWGLNWPFKILVLSQVLRLEMGPDQTQAYFCPKVNMMPTCFWPRYYWTQSEEIFLNLNGKKLKNFGYLGEIFQPKDGWPDQTRTTKIDSNRVKIFWPRPITSLGTPKGNHLLFG